MAKDNIEQKQILIDLMNMEKQTAVEWLTEKLRTEFGFAFSNNILEQAKEIEKQDIIEAYDKGEFNCGMNESAEQYYNDTFKK
jgi:HEPN domain-containing protein